MDKLIKKINTSPLIRRRVTSGDTMQPFSRTFGISLKKLIEKEEFAKVPRIVTNICEFLLINGLETEGIFRVNGNNKAVESIKLLLEENYSLDASNYTDVYAVASVLKLFIRELPDGLIPENIANQMVEVYKRNLNHIEDCVEEFKLLLSALPPENFNLLKYICQFLTKIAEKENINKMNGVNLGIVFGPNVFRCSHDMDGLKLQSGMNNVMTFFISHFNQLFKFTLSGNNRDSNIGSSYLCLDSPLVTQTMSTEGHKSSPSLSGDFDLSSSNDNQMCPAPLPTSISSNLHQAISNCINNHLSEDIDTNSKSIDIQHFNDYRVSRTSSIPHNMSKYPVEVNNEFTELSTKSSTEPTAQPRSNISSSVQSKIKKSTSNSKNSNRKPLLVTQESWNDIIDQKDFSYLTNKSGNQTTMIDDMLPEWQGQNNLIDLDDLDGDVMMNDTKENSILYKTDKTNSLDTAKKCDTIVTVDRKLSINEIQERIKYLRKKLKEFEDNFERQHGCRPQNIEKTGNSQVQEWLTEMVHLREQINLCQLENNFEGLSDDSLIARGSHKLIIQDVNMKSTTQLQSGASTFSGVSEQMGPAQKLKMISSLENVNVQNMTVVQYLDYLNAAIDSQRKRACRPESLSDMTKEQLEDEKMDLQKCLLHFEKLYGRPRENNVKQIMKPLYDRYRFVKRLIKSSESDTKFPLTVTANQINGEYGNSATTVSSRSRGHSNMKPSEDFSDTGKVKKESVLGTSHDSNQMSHSFTLPNEAKSNYWKQSLNTGSWKSGAINMSQESMNKFSTSQNSNTAQRLVPAEPLSHKHGSGSNLKLKYQSSSVPLTAENPNHITPIIYNTPIHSVYSTKSFNSSADDIIPFRSCNTMSRVEIEAEKDILLIEKRKLQKLLKDFEHGLEKVTGRKVEKSDRDNMRADYDRYKTIKCRLRILEKELER